MKAFAKLFSLGLLLCFLFQAGTAEILEGKPLTNIYVKVTGPEYAYSGEAYYLDVRIFNLTGESKDSLLLKMYAPNELKTQSGKDSLFAWYDNKISGADTSYSRIDVNTSNADGLNSQNKLRELSIRLNELAPTSGVNPGKNTHFYFRIHLELDEIPSTWKLLFQFETYDKDDNYIRGADAVWEVPLIQYPGFYLNKVTDRFNNTYSPGDTGMFHIDYFSTKSDVRNMWLYDQFPEKLEFLGAYPDTVTSENPEEMRLAWFDSLLEQSIGERISIRFTNHVLRNECLTFDGETYASPVQVTNYCQLNWRATIRDTSLNRSRHIFIEAEPDLIPEISQLDTTTTVSPGGQVLLKTVGWNRGGSGADTTVGFKLSFAPVVDGTPETPIVFDEFEFPFNRYNFLNPTITDSVDTLTLWTAPERSGWYRIYVEIDPDSMVEELDDLYWAGRMDSLDGPFEANNLQYIDIFVGIDSLNVDVTHVTYKDTIISRNGVDVQGGFPNYIFSYVHVTDQNNRFVKGLADTSRWLSANDTIPIMQQPMSEIWKPLLEYHRDEPNYPPNQDIFQMAPDVLVTEVHDSTSFGLAATGVVAALVLDYSGSMIGEIENSENSARVYLEKMQPQDQTAIIKFGSSVSVLQKLTSDNSILLNALQKKPAVGNGTALYDAIYQGIAEVANASGRKIVIAFTDGYDGVSSLTSSEVIQYAQRLGVAVYTIGYGYNVAVDELTQIASTTGGQYYFSSDWQEISSFYSNISYSLRNYYIMAHTTTDPALNGTWRTVDIGVDYLGQAVASDTGQYKVPVEGIDLWAEVTSFPDSTVFDPETEEIIAKYALPGDTIRYVITFGNNGIQDATNISLENFLPGYFLDNYIPQIINLSFPAQTSTSNSLGWNLVNLAAGVVRTISFDLVLPLTSPDFVVPLIDSVAIQCTGEKAEDLVDNFATDQVMLLPISMAAGEPVPPEIFVTPAEVFALEPATFKVFTKSPLKWWDIWIIEPDSTIDSIEYSGSIAEFRISKTPLMGNTPPLPDDSLTVLPQFFDTLVPADQDTAFYRICLAYVDWFRNDTAFVYDTLLVKSNNMRPDLVPRLDRLELNKSRSPGQPIDISGTIKNLGGHALTAQDEFATLFYYRNLSLTPEDTTHLGKQLLGGPLRSFAYDSISINTITWTPPDTGVYEIFMVADVDSQIWESHDADATFPYNNLTRERVTVRYEPPEVQITHILTHGTLDYLGLEKLKFHENIASIVTVTDQNNLPIPGLASASEWRKAGEVTDVNVALESIWSPLKEFQRDNPAKPANPDLLSSIRINEIVRNMPPHQLSLQAAPGGATAFRAKIALLLDYSANMTTFRTRVEAATKALFEQLLPEDSVMVMPFAEQYSVTHRFTNDAQALSNLAIPQVTTSENYRLNDAIYQATTNMLGENGRKYILVLSAGGTETSLREQAETTELALKTGTPVFVFNCGSDTSLANISRGTGGKFYHLPEWGSLEAMVTDFVKRLNNFYLLIHSSPDPTLDGSWRSVAFTVNYANKFGRDVSHYKAPLDGFDGWVQVESQPDSVNELIKLAKAGETVHYTITYGNNGYLTGTQCQIRNVLPDSVGGLLNATVPPSQVDGRVVIWEIGDLVSGQSGVIQFDLKVNDPMPPFWFWLEDSVWLRCQDLTDVNPQNNQVVDSVLVQPDEWGEPAIVANPAEVAVNAPVALSITTQTPLKTWNILIEYPIASAMGIDETGFNQQIQNRTEPLQPMGPDDYYKIEPDFTDTRIWDTEGTGEKRETYRAILEYTDWFDRQGTTATTFTVFAMYEMWLGQNKFNPDADVSLEINFLSVKDQSIQIKIYNVAGELVRTVFDKFIKAGQHTITWDGRDRNDRIVGSDVYVVILEAGAYKEWRKVVVVR